MSRPVMLVALLWGVLACAHAAPHLVNDLPSRARDGRVQALIEIPAGTNAKWEVDKTTGRLHHEQRDGRPRVVQYLAYPGSYGMIPRTLLPRELGGDGDPLDVLVLGPAIPRGRLVGVRLLGVLEMLDGGERDDKLVAVVPGAPLGDVVDLADLERRHPGVQRIIETWFAGYKGPGVIEPHGWGGEARALEILGAAETAWADAQSPASRKPEATQRNR